MNKRYSDFPFKETEDEVKRYIDFVKSSPYNAVDFDQSKQMGEQGSDYVLKYARGISLYYRKKKIGFINIHRTGKGEFIEIPGILPRKSANLPTILAFVLTLRMAVYFQLDEFIVGTFIDRFLV